MKEIAYKSQYGQDKWVIEEVTNGLTNGYFVDLALGHDYLFKLKEL